MHLLCHVHEAPANIDCHRHLPGLVHRPGNAHAKAFHVRRIYALMLHDLLHTGGHIRQNVFSTVLLASGHLPFVQHIALQVKEAAFHGRSAHIYSKYISAHCLFSHFHFSISFILYMACMIPCWPLPVIRYSQISRRLLCALPGSPVPACTAPWPHCNPSSSVCG